MSGQDATNPQHYKSHPSGVECITVTEWMNFNRGNAVKYIWRAGEKGGAAKEIEDLRKARWYIDREIQRLSRGGPREIHLEALRNGDVVGDCTTGCPDPTVAHLHHGFVGDGFLCSKPNGLGGVCGMSKDVHFPLTSE